MEPDKVSWGEGPWQSEPDEDRWEDEATGLPCQILRQPVLGHLCGYVGVPKGHPQHGTGGHNLRCHGGVTFYGTHDHSGFWWFGFDCGHGVRDYSPGLTILNEHLRNCLAGPENYRTMEYVKEQCTSLALQLFIGEAQGAA